MTSFPGCCTNTENNAESVTNTENGAESVGNIVTTVCGIERYPYIITYGGFGSVNLYGTSKKLIMTRGAFGSVNLYGTSKKLIITLGAK